MKNDTPEGRLDKRTQKSFNRKNQVKCLAMAICIALNAGCDKPEVPDVSAPRIDLKEAVLFIEPGQQVTPSTLVLSVTDNKDQSPTITANLNNQNISYSSPYAFSTVGNYILKIIATDASGNRSSADVYINVGTGEPTIVGLDNLQTAISPIVDAVMDLLKGIQATDAKDGDITSKIKVHLKNNLGQYTEIATPRAYTAEFPGNIDLKYQIVDNDGHTVEIPKTLTVAPKVQEAVTVPQMTIMPTDPAFNPNSPDWTTFDTAKNRYEYLDKLNIPESWAMGEAMIRSGTNSLTPAQYLTKLNKRQVALNNGAPVGTLDTDGQFVIPNTKVTPNIHEDICNQILLAKKNNGIGSTGIVGPIIQQSNINKAIWMEDRSSLPIKTRLQNNPDKCLILSTSSGMDISKTDVQEILMSGRVLRFNAGGNNYSDSGQPKTISVSEGYTTGDPREYCSDTPGCYNLGTSVPVGVQRVGGARETFDVTIGERNGTVKTSLLRGDSKDIRYAPGCHAFMDPAGSNKIAADKSVPTSRATPVQAGLTYLVAVAYPELTPVELIKKMREDYVKPVTVNYSLDQTKSFTSKTTDVGKAFESLNAKIPSQVSLSASSPIVIAKGRYKFNIIHGDGIIKSDGNTLTQTDINDVSKRGTLSQETYSISPVLLKKLGHKAGDKITIHISVCSDAAEDYKQIQDLTYEVSVVN